MAERPVDTREVPEGYELVPVEDAAWRLVTGKLCRQRTQGRSLCREPSVAELDRNDWRGEGHSPNWWAYCSAHLYGRWIEDGKVMHWILRERIDG